MSSLERVPEVGSVSEEVPASIPETYVTLEARTDDLEGTIGNRADSVGDRIRAFDPRTSQQAEALMSVLERIAGARNKAEQSLRAAAAAAFFALALGQTEASAQNTAPTLEASRAIESLRQDPRLAQMFLSGYLLAAEEAEKRPLPEPEVLRIAETASGAKEALVSEKPDRLRLMTKVMDKLCHEAAANIGIPFGGLAYECLKEIGQTYVKGKERREKIRRVNARNVLVLERTFD